MSAIKHDLYRYERNVGWKAFLKVFFRYPGFRFMFFKRICERRSLLHPAGLVARMWYKRLQVKFGYQIPHKCRIGGGLFLGHYGNIVVNQAVVVGKNCNIAQGVTLGHVSRGEKKGSPVIGDFVWIGANAVVVGNIRVGNNVLIAPLTYVNFDVPDNAVVMGSPGNIVNYKSSEGYIKNVLT